VPAVMWEQQAGLLRSDRLTVTGRPWRRTCKAARDRE
jgi:hypothetical protein